MCLYGYVQAEMVLIFEKNYLPGVKIPEKYNSYSDSFRNRIVYGEEIGQKPHQTNREQ